jgi:hypothetical protein
VSVAVDLTFDYLALIGLVPADLEKFWLPDIQELIKKRKKEWTGQAINPLYQQQARSNLERVRQFEQLLQSPESFQAYVNILRELLASRREEQEQEIGELINVATGGRRNVLTFPQRELLGREADERGIPVTIVDDLIKRLGLEIVPTEKEADAGGLRLPYREPAMDKAILAQINRTLKVLGKKSFYEALDLSAKESPARIKGAARLQFEKWSKSLPKTAECVAWEKSMQACLTYLQDEEAKERYDRALFNERLDEFLRRVDLTLAAGRLTREAHVLLSRLGVQEFGLMSAEVNQCILVRGVARGVPVTKPVQVSVQLEGQVRCARCFAWTPARSRNCIHCSGSLLRTCRNPSCNQPLLPGAKVCSHCGLSAAKGGQYAELLKLCDLLLDGGSAKAALDTCRLAAQALSGVQIDRRVARATEIRKLNAALRSAIAERRWLAVEQHLQKLAPLAPRFAQPGIPTLEEVVQRLSQWRQTLEQLAAGETQEAPAAIASLLEILSLWRDAPDLGLRSLQVCRRLESQSRYEEALRLAEALVAFPECQKEAVAVVSRLQELVQRHRETTAEFNEGRRNWQRAWADRRFYAADRALSAMHERGDESVSEADTALLRQKLAQVRDDVQTIQQLAASGVASDELISRHLAVLRECRDCRESLSALQQLTPLPPEAPRNLKVTLQGNRRLVQWQTPPGDKLPSGYVVQRAWGRSGSKQAEMAFLPLTTGSRSGELCGELQFLDDEVVHSGDILQYSVQAAFRGAHEVEGHILREYTVLSAPTVSESILIWHETLGLKARSIAGAIELQWHRPAGVREILLERWPGHRDDAPQQPERIAGIDAPLYRDTSVAPETPCTYRLRCVYDGPQGEFITPGVCVSARLTASGGQMEALAETAPPAAGNPHEAAVVNGTASLTSTNPQDLTSIVESAPLLPVVEEPEQDHVNPLKRFGIWPPHPEESQTAEPNVESSANS